MQVKLVELAKIKPYKKNAKTHPPEQVEKIKKCIQLYGWDVPLVLDENYQIIKGHGRFLAAKALKLKQVPCVIRSDLTDEQVRAARIADNRVSESEWNEQALMAEFEDLPDMDFTGLRRWISSGL